MPILLTYAKEMHKIKNDTKTKNQATDNMTGNDMCNEHIHYGYD